MKVNGINITQCVVVLPNWGHGSVAGLLEKLEANKAPSNLAGIGR